MTAAFVRAVKTGTPSSSRALADKIPFDPEDRNRHDLLRGCDKYLDHDYILDDQRTTTSTPDENDYFDYFPDVDYYCVYFFHIPAISFFPASNPKIPPIHTCAPKP